jgi:hypothetical protein
VSKEDYEVFSIIKKEQQQAGCLNRQRAIRDFKEASILAARNGLRLSKCNGGMRYRLEKSSVWMKDIYPGNGRIYCPNQQKKGPYFRIPGEWSLIDVVRAAIQAEGTFPVQRSH